MEKFFSLTSSAHRYTELGSDKNLTSLVPPPIVPVGVTILTPADERPMEVTVKDRYTDCQIGYLPILVSNLSTA